MLIALIGYLGTMVMALAALAAAWFVVIGPPPKTAHEPPRAAIGEIGRTTALYAPPQQARPGTQPAPSGTQPGTQSGTWGPAVVHRADDGAAAANTDDARAAAEQAAVEKAKQAKLARYRKRKEQEARQRQDQQAQQDQQDGQYGLYGQYGRTALGYDQEGRSERAPPSPPPPLFFFGPRRY